VSEEGERETARGRERGNLLRAVLHDSLDILRGRSHEVDDRSIGDRLALGVQLSRAMRIESRRETVPEGGG
jgi:hypothetical protein